jgi:hypothetical protein
MNVTLSTGSTSMAICVLRKASALQPSHIERRIRERAQTGRDFLLVRRCSDGGWNHGSSRALGYEAESYAETTGVALLGLTGVPHSTVDPSLRRAAAELPECRSAQGQAWLRLALLSHAWRIPAGGQARARRDVTDTALDILARAAEGGTNVFTA